MTKASTSASASILAASSLASSIPWTARLKHHPIFCPSGSVSASATATASASASASASRFANASILINDLDSSCLDLQADVDLDLHDLPAPRNVLAALGQILAVVVHGQLRLLSLRAVKSACASLPPNATEHNVIEALQNHAPYWRVHLPAVAESPSSSSSTSEQLDSPWIQLLFNQTGRFLALLAAHRLLVIDFGSSLARLADAPIPAQQQHHSGAGIGIMTSSTFSLTTSLGTLPIIPPASTTTIATTATLGYLDHDHIPTLPATLYELGQSNLAFASASAPLIQCAWHPMSKDHTDLVVLSRNAHLAVFSVLASINAPVHVYPVLDEQAARDRTNPMMADVHASCTPVAMTFGVMSALQRNVEGVAYKVLRPERVWNKCTVYVAMRDGSVKAVCPVLPRVWNMSLFDYKCMRTSLLTLTQDPMSSASPLAFTALARFLTHINAQLDPEHQVRAPLGTHGGLRFSDTVPRDADLPDAASLCVMPTDTTTCVSVDAPVYEGVCPFPQPLAMDPGSLPTESSVDLRAVCTDVCAALAEAGALDDVNGDGAAQGLDVQVPVVLVAWYSGQVDVLCTDVVWPTWGTQITDSRPRRLGLATADPLTWVVKQGADDGNAAAGQALGVCAFATETIRLDIAPGLVRLAMDPVVAGQIVVAHSEGVHQVVVRLGAPSIAHQVVDTVPLKGFESDLQLDDTGDASMVMGGGSRFQSLNASTILGKPATTPPMLRNPVLGCVAIGDAMLGHSAIVVTHDDASATLLYTIDLALADLDDDDAFDPATLSAASRAVLDLAAPFQSPIAPYPFVSLANIPDTLPVVSRLTLPESPADGVSEQQLEYLANKSGQLGKSMQPLSALVDQMKDALDVMRTLEAHAQTLLQSLAFHKKSVLHKLDAAELAVVEVETRADAMLQVIHDVRHPTHLTPAERKYHREVVRAAHEVGGLVDRVGKVLRMRPKFAEWADDERVRREERVRHEEEMFGGPLNSDMVTRLMDLLQAQYQAIKKMEDELHRVGASEELRKRLEQLEV